MPLLKLRQRQTKGEGVCPPPGIETETNEGYGVHPPPEIERETNEGELGPPWPRNGGPNLPGIKTDAIEREGGLPSSWDRDGDK